MLNKVIIVYLTNSLLGLLLDVDDPTNPLSIIQYEDKAIVDVDKRTKKLQNKALKRIGIAIDKVDRENPFSIDSDIRKIENELTKFGKKSAPLSSDAVYNNSEKFYKDVKRSLSDKTGYPYSFVHPDEVAIERINTMQDIFIGDHYQDDVTRQASKIIRDTINETRTLSTSEVAKRLKEQMPGIVKQKGYHYTIASQVLASARSYSNMMFYRDARIAKFEVLSVRDERTSAICKFMDGEVLEVNAALDRYKLYDEVRTKEEYKSVNPWISETPAGLMVNGISIEEMSGPELQALGINAPPYHGNCRSTVVASI